ncbi:MAG: excinuclease ATPase subunit [Myxococcaceae bacterium]
MKKLMALSLFAVTFATPALARDTVYKIPLADVLAMPEAKQKLDGSVKFFLAGAKTPKVLETRGTEIVNKKTNAANKTDEFACKWAALSALIDLQQAAKRNGANAVVEISSYYKRTEWKHATDFECHAGTFVAGVALKGDFVRIDK